MIWRPKDSLVVALDVPTLDDALAAADLLKEQVGLFKIGLQLFCAAGPAGLEKLAERGVPLFLDLKLHDIPNTVAGAVKSTGQLPGVRMMTIHAMGGAAMVRAAAKMCDVNRKLLAVTMLTSMDAAAAAEVGVSRSLEDQVVALARMAVGCGADGVVASPQEVAVLRAALGPHALIVTPGIRSATDDAEDQARTSDPATAMRLGSNYLVVGRPIMKAADPVKAAQDIVKQIASAFHPA